MYTGAILEQTHTHTHTHTHSSVSGCLSTGSVSPPAVCGLLSEASLVHRKSYEEEKELESL